MKSRFLHRWIRILLLLIGLILAAGCTDAKPLQTTQPEPSATPTAIPSLPWWNNRVFYEIFVRSFYDSNGDGIGDLNGVTEKLDYLNDGDPETHSDLGITGIWLMPVAEAASYHGYDVIDYRKVEQDYGTNDDFKKLMAEAHKRGIVVIVDLVLNHTSDQNPWFIASQNPTSSYANWYLWEDQNPGYKGPWGEQVWHELNGRYYYGMFTAQMPDLNYEDPDVTAEMDDVARFWLEDMGADGFRLDAARLLVEDGQKQENTPGTHAWLKQFHGKVKAIKPESLVVGEIWSPSLVVSKYTSDEVDLAFEFDLAAEMVRAPDQGDGKYLTYVQEQSLSLFPAGQYAAFLTNHDQNRVMSNYGGDINKAKVAAALLLTNPGVPFIYYGEEIGMTGEKPDEHIRRPMQWDNTPETAGFTTAIPWEPVGDNPATFNVAVETGDPISLLSTYRTLISLREGHELLETGEMIPIESSSGAVYAYLRHDANETMMILINLSDKEQADYTLKLDKGPLHSWASPTLLLGNSTISVPNLTDTGGFDNYTPVKSLAPYSILIVSIQP